MHCSSGSVRVLLYCALLIAAATGNAYAEPGASASSVPQSAQVVFPEGTATSSEMCGACHQAIYKEYAEGFGSDLHWAAMKGPFPGAALLVLPRGTPRSATAHAVAGVDPFPLAALQFEEGGKRCIICHYPEPLIYPDISAAKIVKPTPRPENQEAGITCASCHLTPDGAIRGPYGVNAPHRTVKEERIQTSVACAFCHSAGERVVGKQTQTFLEWREDFNKPGLGPQQCQDCHMPRTVRKLAEEFDGPERASARHLWTGGHSHQRIKSALVLTIDQLAEDKTQLAIHVTNVGAGHSVPTGSNRRAVHLRADVINADNKIIATREWLFAPWFADRADDRAFLEEDRKGLEPVAAAAADAQGPHESIIRAGEDRVLDWAPKITPGRYNVRATLIYDLNRYNDRAFTADQHEIGRAALDIRVGASRPAQR